MLMFIISAIITSIGISFWILLLFDSKTTKRAVFTVILFFTLFNGSFWLGVSADDMDGNTYKQGQIDAINGEFKYEQEIHYRQSDGFIIPVDTVYNKIEEDK